MSSFNKALNNGAVEAISTSDGARGHGFFNKLRMKSQQ
jgi:hypothetical protein